MQKGVDGQGVRRASVPLSGMQPEEQSQRAHTSFNILTWLQAFLLSVCVNAPRSKDREEMRLSGAGQAGFSLEKAERQAELGEGR